MLSNKEAKVILDNCLTTGGDFADLFMEDTIENTIEYSSGEVSKTSTSYVYGAGIRILHHDEEVYGYTNDCSFTGLSELGASLAQSFNYEPVKVDFEFDDVIQYDEHKIVRVPKETSNKDKVAYLKEVYEVAKNYSPLITQVMATITDQTQDVTIFNTEGKIVKDRRSHVRIRLVVVASRDGIVQTTSDTFGRNQGLEIYDQSDLKEFATSVAEAAVTMLDAKDIEGQQMPVVIHNGFGGVILHEACVHALEATCVAKGLSVFCGKLGEKIASDIVTAVDDGTLTNSWGSLNVDDEGNRTQRNVLIENGILKSYLIDKRNGITMKSESTGSGRRESYRYSPTSRMTNTFFENGSSTVDEIIANTEYGLFAKKMGGGSVNPATGEFNFAVNEAYMIENGKLTYPVKGVTLVGSGPEVLQKIDMIANNLSFGHGMCGSLSGSIPTDVGQPTIRVSSMTVGGRGGN
jgi:TldD protein